VQAQAECISPAIEDRVVFLAEQFLYLPIITSNY